MNVLNLNKFKIRSAFIKSLFVVDAEDPAATTLKINEELFFQKLGAFLPFFEWEKDLNNLLCIYLESNADVVNLRLSINERSKYPEHLPSYPEFGNGSGEEFLFHPNNTHSHLERLLL